MNNFEETFTFDDVLLMPGYSTLRPRETDASTQFTRNIRIKAPLVSAPMDTVTGSRLAITLALQGGIGIIHKNMPPEQQAEEVLRVKKFENGFIENPFVLLPEDTIEKVVRVRKERGFNKIPIVDRHNVFVGLISELDYSIPDDLKIPIKFKMRPADEIITGKKGITLDKANTLIKKHRLAVLPILGANGRLVAIVSRKDLEKNVQFPDSAKDDRKNLRVGAAVSIGQEALQRAKLTAEAGVDVLVIDVAHGHSKGVIDTLRLLKKEKSLKDVDVVAGNVATAEGAKALVAAGADAIKVGVGPGSICTTRIIAGIGVPQLSAILEAKKGRAKSTVPIIADGGIRFSGDIVKALAAGANTVMIGNLFAGTDEAPGDIEYHNGQMYKSYRGMGSRDAMLEGSKDRYGQSGERAEKLVPEGVVGRVRYKGPLAQHVHQLVGGLRAGLAYVGAQTIPQLQQKAKFVRITQAGKVESHPYNISITKESPNYSA